MKDTFTNSIFKGAFEEEVCNKKFKWEAGTSAEGTSSTYVYLTIHEKCIVDDFIRQLGENPPILNESYSGNVWISDIPESTE